MTATTHAGADKTVKHAKKELKFLRSMNRNNGQPNNVADWERVASAAVGLGLLGFALRKRGMTGGLLAMLGGSLLHRGATGQCAIYSALGVNTADPRRVAVTPDDTRTTDRRKQEFDESPVKDVVEEASEESFPASDPPANW
jgi:hypothetical protein